MPGLYTWTSQGSVNDHSLIRLKTGIVIRGDSDADKTVLDGERQGRIFWCPAAAGNITIERLTLRRGLGLGSGPTPIVERAGGSILVEPPSALILNDCIVEDNELIFGKGAGVACANATVTRCEFRNNRGGEGAYGVALFSSGSLTIRDSKILDNFTGGDPSGYAAGIYAEAGTVTNCEFRRNWASGITDALGAALILRSGFIDNSVFAENTCVANAGESSSGGALACDSCEVRNSVFLDNAARAMNVPGQGAALFADRARISRCTFVRNRSQPCCPPGSGSYMPVVVRTRRRSSVASSIFAWNLGAAVSDSVIIDCSDRFGNTSDHLSPGIDGEQNITLDPLFCGADSVSGDGVHLRSSSPCLPENRVDTCGTIGARGSQCE